MMLTTTNVHDVTSIKMEQRVLASMADGTWMTIVTAFNPQGERFELTLFHKGPMPVQGAEFVNFVAHDQPA